MNRTLRELHLGGNKLSGEDAVHLANLLRANSKLKLLNLANNFLKVSVLTWVCDRYSVMILSRAL